MVKLTQENIRLLAQQLAKVTSHSAKQLNPIVYRVSKWDEVAASNLKQHVLMAVEYAHKFHISLDMAATQVWQNMTGALDTDNPPQGTKEITAPPTVVIPIQRVFIFVGGIDNVLGFEIGDCLGPEKAMVHLIESHQSGWVARDVEGYPLGFISAGNNAVQISYARDVEAAEILKASKESNE